MSKNIIEIAINAGFINTSNGLESPFIEGEDLTDNLKLFASLLLAQPEQTEQITFKDDADKIAHLENSVELLAGLLDAKKREPLSDGCIFAPIMNTYS